MRKRNWTLFAVLAVLAALAAMSIGGAGSAVAASASASGATASGEEAVASQRRLGRRIRRIASRVAARVARRVARRVGGRGPRGPAGPAGPPGPQGPPGTVSNGGTVSGGWSKIFFAANGVAPTTTLIDVNNLNFQTDCTGNDHDPEFRTLVDNAGIKMGQIYDPNTVEYNANRTFSTGETFDEDGTDNTEGDGFEDDDANSNAIYANSLGQIVEIKIWMVDDENSMFNTVDCFIGGGYVAL